MFGKLEDPSSLNPPAPKFSKIFSSVSGLQSPANGQWFWLIINIGTNCSWLKQNPSCGTPRKSRELYFTRRTGVRGPGPGNTLEGATLLEKISRIELKIANARFWNDFREHSILFWFILIPYDSVSFIFYFVEWINF